jgi:hypothetical protein
MNRLIFAVIFFCMVALFVAQISFAQVGLSAKLPYAKGESFIVTTGYNSPPTHIKKDSSAIDFTQNGCDAYGKSAVASVSGTAWIVEEAGYNGGYGTQLLIASDGNVVGRYAHLIQGSIAVSAGDDVKQGTALGKIGDTGLVMGVACAEHPGTHIHFALYDKNQDGSFAARNPEPISGYADIQEGKWYLSDNGLNDAVGGNASQGAVLGAAIENQPSNPSQSSSANAGTNIPVIPVGGAGIAIATSPSPPPLQTSSAASLAEVTSGTSFTQSTSSSLQTDSISSPQTVSSTLPQAASTTSTSSPQVALTTPTSSPQENFTASFNSSTLAVDFSWQPFTVSGVEPPDGSNSLGAPASTSTAVTYSIFDLGDVSSSVASATSVPALVGVTTSTAFSYPVSDQDFGHDVGFKLQAADSSGSVFAFPAAAVWIPNWFVAIQSDDSAGSIGSWYDDNWYNLGTGFYGTIRSLTFEGYVNTDRYPQFPAHLWLQEFLDSDYVKLNQTFAISDGAPFTDRPAMVTIGGLDIPLQPNKYYRLATYEQLQNHSIILKGTAAVSTSSPQAAGIVCGEPCGTAMWDEFVPLAGIVRHEYPFYPYISAIMVPNYPPLAPPNQPADLSLSFDQFALALDVSWPASTDPDTNAGLLTYQFNVSTSTLFDDAQWQLMGNNLSTRISVALGNAYMVGVRAVDDFGNVSVPAVETWNFPSGFTPYILGSWMSLASQDFMLSASSTPAAGVMLHSIGIFTGDFASGSRYPDYNWCTMDLFDMENTSTDGGFAHLASNDGLNRGYGGCLGSPVFTFDSSAVQLLPEHHYRWVFNANTGNVSTQAAVRFYGTASDTARGAFSDSTLANAKFTVNTDAGTVFSN